MTLCAGCNAEALEIHAIQLLWTPIHVTKQEPFWHHSDGFWIAAKSEFLESRKKTILTQELNILLIKDYELVISRNKGQSS